MYLKNLFSLNRSLAGIENRKTLKYIKKNSPILIKSFQAATKSLIGKFQKNGNLDGFIKDNFGNKLVDVKNNNLHVASYSQPIKNYLH